MVDTDWICQYFIKLEEGEITNYKEVSQETISPAKNNCLDSSCCFILFLPHRKPDAAHSEVLKPCQAGGGVVLLLFNCHYLRFR